MLRILLLAPILFLSGCATLTQSNLIRNFSPVGASEFKYEDKQISISYVPDTSKDAIPIKVSNLSSEAIRIIWDESSFIDENGKSLRVMHAGVKIADRGASMPPTVVPPGASIDDMIAPADKTEWGTYSNRWVTEPVCGSRPPFTTEIADEACVGKEFGIFITYEVGSKKMSQKLKFRYDERKKPEAKKKVVAGNG